MNPTPTRTVLLRAIAADPGDDLPRLAYADELRLTGKQEDEDRADFIIAQIKPPGFDHSHATERIWDLLKKHKTKWWKEAGLDKEYIQDVRFHNGFIEEIEMSARDFLCHADEILKGTVRRVQLHGAAPSFFPGLINGLANSPHLLKLTELNLISNRIGEEGAEALADSPYLANLTKLYLGDGDIGPENNNNLGPGREVLRKASRTKGNALWGMTWGGNMAGTRTPEKAREAAAYMDASRFIGPPSGPGGDSGVGAP